MDYYLVDWWIYGKLITYQDFDFAADTTYLITGPTYITGTTTLEPGAIIKFTDGSSPDDPVAGLNVEYLACPTGAQPMAVLTSVDDNSVGEPIGSGSPVTGTYNFYLRAGGNPNNIQDIAVSNLKVSYAANGVQSGSVVDSEFYHCAKAVTTTQNENNWVVNDLFSACDVPVSGGGGVEVEQVTCDSAHFTDGTIYANILNSLFTGDFNGVEYLSSYDPATLNLSPGIFQTVNGDHYYLANNSPYRNTGSTAIDGSTAQDIAQRTTYPPPQSQAQIDSDTPDLGYHYIPVQYNLLFNAWLAGYFGADYLDNPDAAPTADPNGNGLNNWQDYLAGNAPVDVSFSISVASQFVSSGSVPVQLSDIIGAPDQEAVVIDPASSSSYTSATWSSLNASPTVSIGSGAGMHDIAIGLRRSADQQATWHTTTVVLDGATPALTITSPANNASFNASRVNVTGTFTSASIRRISVNGVPAFIHSADRTFEAVNVPLASGANTISAVIEDFVGRTTTASISITTTPNEDNSLNDPMQLAASPGGGFVSLEVTFQPTANAPGTFQSVIYDFEGGNAADQTAADLNAITHTYSTVGQYFPVATVQTSVGRFSSLGGWNDYAVDPDDNPIRISVLPAPTAGTPITVTDPVGLKWTSDGHLYVLSGSTATITEFDTSGTSVRSLSGIGTGPSGLDVDSSGNVYVADTGDNQVRKFNPSGSTFAADTTFGQSGHIGLTSAQSGTGQGEFNAPFDVAVAPDGSALAVSDTGNDRLQFFDLNGTFKATLGSTGTDLGEFSGPKGLAYDAGGELYVLDSGNNRVVQVNDVEALQATGTAGSGFGQLSGPLYLSFGEHGAYLADTGNGRVQSFYLPQGGSGFTATPNDCRFTYSTGLNSPAAIVGTDDLVTEKFYVADTGNNRITSYSLTPEDPSVAWSTMVTKVAGDDLDGAISQFSITSADDYRQMFLTAGWANTKTAIVGIGVLTPVFIDQDQAEYYFTDTIDGQVITFPVEFTKENGVWKLEEF